MMKSLNVVIIIIIIIILLCLYNIVIMSSRKFRAGVKGLHLTVFLELLTLELHSIKKYM